MNRASPHKTVRSRNSNRPRSAHIGCISLLCEVQLLHRAVAESVQPAGASARTIGDRMGEGGKASSADRVVKQKLRVWESCLRLPIRFGQIHLPRKHSPRRWNATHYEMCTVALLTRTTTTEIVAQAWRNGNGNFQIQDQQFSIWTMFDEFAQVFCLLPKMRLAVLRQDAKKAAAPHIIADVKRRSPPIPPSPVKQPGTW
jgi:hypothetical protein